MFERTKSAFQITLLAAGLGLCIVGCGDDSEDTEEDTDDTGGTDTGKVTHKVTFTVKVPADFDGPHDSLAATFYINYDPDNLAVPKGFAGPAVKNPEIGPDKPYVWNGDDEGLSGMYRLVVILYLPKDGFMPGPGDYIKVSEPMELGNGDVDYGEIMLELIEEEKDTDSE